MMRHKQLSLILLISLLLISIAATGRKTTLTLTPPKTTATKHVETIEIDTTSTGKEILLKIVCAGFDKTPSSTKESLFISNHTGKNIYSITFEITYLTQDSLILHRRQVTVDKGVPSGETRKFDFTSFDTQRSFHYLKSIPSRRATTPFDVRISIIKASFEKI